MDIIVIIAQLLKKSRQKKERTTFFLSEEKDDVLHPRHDKMAPRTKLVAKVPLAKKKFTKGLG